MKRGSGAQHGFTLIELLVSLTIFSVIAVAVYSVFAARVGAWRKAQDFSSAYHTARPRERRLASQRCGPPRGQDHSGGRRDTLHEAGVHPPWVPRESDQA